MRYLAAGWLMAWSALAAAQETPAGLAELVRLLSAPASANAAMVALRATGDAELSGLFEAAARHGDTRQREFALDVLRELGGPSAAQVFAWALQNDPDPGLRAAALAHLGQMKAISADELAALLTSPQIDLRLLAGRQLLAMGQGQLAREALTGLAGSSDASTAALARVSLLSLGQAEQLAGLSRLLEDPKSDPQVVLLVLEAAVENRIAALAEPARKAAENSPLMPVRLSAWRTYSELAPGASDELAQAVTKTDQSVLRVRLMWILADRPDAQAAMKRLSEQSGLVGLLARFELARPGGGEQAQQALGALLIGAHPVVVDYVLERAKADLASRPGACGFYAQPLLGLVSGVDRQAGRMGPDHMRAARAATLLADLGNPAALEGLRGLLNGPYDGVSRSVAAGLVQTRNRAAVELARPLLDSPYEEMSTDALMALGRLGDPQAQAGLQRIVDGTDSHPHETVALASWYLIKTQHQQELAAPRLAQAFH